MSDAIAAGAAAEYAAIQDRRKAAAEEERKLLNDVPNDYVCRKGSSSVTTSREKNLDPNFKFPKEPYVSLFSGDVEIFHNKKIQSISVDFYIDNIHVARRNMFLDGRKQNGVLRLGRCRYEVNSKRTGGGIFGSIYSVEITRR